MPDTAKQLTVSLEQHQALMQCAFSHCHPVDDWRAPIDVIVPFDAANVYMQAIEFMTAVRPNVEPVKVNGATHFRLTCVGYRNGPAGP